MQQTQFNRKKLNKSNRKILFKNRLNFFKRKTKFKSLSIDMPVGDWVDQSISTNDSTMLLLHRMNRIIGDFNGLSLTNFRPIQVTALKFLDQRHQSQSHRNFNSSKKKRQRPDRFETLLDQVRQIDEDHNMRYDHKNLFYLIDKRQRHTNTFKKRSKTDELQTKFVQEDGKQTAIASNEQTDMAQFDSTQSKEVEQKKDLNISNCSQQQQYINHITINNNKIYNLQINNKLIFKIRKKQLCKNDSNTNTVKKKHKNPIKIPSLSLLSSSTSSSISCSLINLILLFTIIFNINTIQSTQIESELDNLNKTHTQLTYAATSVAALAPAAQSEIFNLTQNSNQSTLIETYLLNKTTIVLYNDKKNDNNNNEKPNTNANKTDIYLNTNNSKNMYYNNSLDIHSLQSIPINIDQHSTASSSSSIKLLNSNNDDDEGIAMDHAAVPILSLSAFRSNEADTDTDTINLDNIAISSSTSMNSNYNQYINSKRINAGCHSCQFLEQVKLENIESIKKHILMRLELKEVPKIAPSFRSTVPPEIIESFYKGNRKLRDQRYDNAPPSAPLSTYDDDEDDMDVEDLNAAISSASVGSKIKNNRHDGSNASAATVAASITNNRQKNSPTALNNDTNVTNNNKKNASTSFSSFSANQSNNNRKLEQQPSQQQNLHRYNQPSPSTSYGGGTPASDQHNIKSTSATSLSSGSVMMQDYNVAEYTDAEDFIDENDIYDDFDFENEDYIADEPNLKDEFFSIVNSLYVFPTISRMRHHRKSEILNFSIQKSDHSTVSEAFLYIYIRGRDWVAKNEPKLYDNKFKNINLGNSNNNNNIVLTINKVIRRQNFTHTLQITESRHQIPMGQGQWFHINVTEMVQNWMANPIANHGIVIKTQDIQLRSLIVIDDGLNDKNNGLYIEIQTKDNRKRRSKRNASLNCLETDKEERCCRYPLEINFQKFGWDWIIAPTTFSAYFCSGQCKLGYIQKFPHTHLMQLSTAPQPCCSPSKMSPIRLLYFNHDNILVMSTIPNMSIDQCNCS